MNRRLKDLFKGAVVKVVSSGVYQDSGNKYCEVSINGKKLGQRFNSFINVRCKGGYSDFQRQRLVLASDDYMKDSSIQVYGVKFDLEERVSRKNEKYLAIMFNGKKVGYFINNKQRACFNNVCL